MKVSKCWKIVEFPKFSIKTKNCKTFYEAQTESHLAEIIWPHPQASPHQVKSYLTSGTNIFLWRYTEIYRHLLSKCFRNAVLRRQEMVQMLFLIPNRNKLFWSKFGFLGNALGRFCQFFFNFSSSAKNGGRHFYSVPPRSPSP